MKTFLVLESANGDLDTVEWGCVPNEWNVPYEDYMKHYELVAITHLGHLWWKKRCGHYLEK
jgi:hypothetical protein